MFTEVETWRVPGGSTGAIRGRPVSATASAPTNRKQPRRYQPRRLLPLCHLRAWFLLVVVFRFNNVDALLPLAGRSNPCVTEAFQTLTKRGVCRSSSGSIEMTQDAAGTHLCPPVLELITPDGCASSSPSDQSSLVANVQKAVAGGVSLVQLRDYKSSAKSKAELAVRLVAATEGRALFVVNGEPKAAFASGADGVHLPERMIGCLMDLRGTEKKGWPRVIGCSVHSIPAAVEAARLGADYVQVGTMFATQSHPGKVPEGVGMLNDVQRQLQAEGFSDVLVIGVGGIDGSNCGEVVEAGGDGVAAIRCLCSSSDAESEARHIMRGLRGGSLVDPGSTGNVRDGR
ncbi:unnamed protein product [Scytosiphon promiscuus]